MAEPTPEDIERFIAANLACEHVEVEGDGRHFFATIVSREFEGANRIARHQRVYRALGDRMREQIHALLLKTMGVVAEAGGDGAATMALGAADVHSREAAYELVKTMRASILVLGP